MKPDRVAADLERFLAERGAPLLRSAALLTGSREAGEDLLQAALERLLQHWQSIDGVGAIRMIMTLPSAATGTLWVNPATYLPVRITFDLGGGMRDQTDFRWLPPTRANLAQLHVTIPAGFTRVRPPKG